MTAQHGVEHRRRLLQARLRRLRPDRLLPKETKVHLRNVAREQLLALRSLLDAAVARLEQPRGKQP